MLDTMAGRIPFRKALSRYFRRFDGNAVTTDDFLRVIEEETGMDLNQFRNWYEQAGTPVCSVTGIYDSDMEEYTLEVSQSCRTTDKPFHFPLRLGLLDSSGKDMELNIKGDSTSFDKDKSLLHIKRERKIFTFSNISSEPVPSLLRDFSAPVLINYDYSEKDLIFLLDHDSDKFNRYDAGQRLALNTIIALAEDEKTGRELQVNSEVSEAFSAFMDAGNDDPMFCSKVIQMPNLATVANSLEDYDINRAHKARQHFLKFIAETSKERLLHTYESLKRDTYSNTASAIAERSLKNICLSYLGILDGEFRDLVYDQFIKADNMTDVTACLSILANEKSNARDKAFELFYQKWKDDKQVINLWFSIQAGGQCEAVYDYVLKMAGDQVFDKNNPNKFRSLYGEFANNLVHFHHDSGRGYQLIANKIIEMDDQNPIVAAGLCKTFSRFRRLDQLQKGLMETELKKMRDKKNVSPNLMEVIELILNK